MFCSEEVNISSQLNRPDTNVSLVTCPDIRMGLRDRRKQVSMTLFPTRDRHDASLNRLQDHTWEVVFPFNQGEGRGKVRDADLDRECCIRSRPS